MQQMQLEQSQQMQQKLLHEEQQLQLQMQQLSVQPTAVPQIPQPAPVPQQQYVQQTYSPAVAQAPANVAPEIQTQQMTMPVQLQQPELARTCSSGSDISNPQPPMRPPHPSRRPPSSLLPPPSSRF